MKIVVAILMLIPSLSWGQKWTLSVDPFTKAKTWHTDVFNVKIKTNGLFDASFLKLQLLGDTTGVLAFFSFNSDLRYEATVNEETKIAFLYTNDSTETASVVFAKSTPQHLMGQVFYISRVGFDSQFLREPLTALRFKLADAYRDYTLKEGAGTSLLHFVNSCLDTKPQK